MQKSRDRSSSLEPIRRVSQIRQYSPEAVPDKVVDQLTELARWTGSSKNSQPWRLIVVRDKDRLKKIADLRPNINWLAGAPLGIAIVLDGANPMSEAYDEGRLTERLLTGATMLGYGGGVAWFGDATQQADAKRTLGIPDDLTARQIVMIGRPKSTTDPRPTGPPRGRKPISELVSYDRWGEAKQK
jgi:nitroreductase